MSKKLIKLLPPPIPAGYYRPKHVAAWLGLSRRTIPEMFDRGDLAGFRLPSTGDRMISRESLWRFCLKHKITVPAIGLYPFSVVAIGIDGPTSSAITKGVKSRESIVTVARNQTEFVILAARGDKVLAIVDASIGSDNAVEIATEMKGNDVTKNVMLIAIAGEDMAPVRIIQAGYDRVFRRPFNVRTLVDLIVKNAKQFREAPRKK